MNFLIRGGIVFDRPISAKSRVETLLLSLSSVHAQYARFLAPPPDRKSTRLNSSHVAISYAVFCLKKKKKNNNEIYTNNIMISNQKCCMRSYVSAMEHDV